MCVELLTSRYRHGIEQTLRDILSCEQCGDAEYLHMIAYHMGWEDPDTVTAGKRTRPLLTLLCATSSGGDWELALPLAAGVELIHNFSLIHDDIQDNSRLRRNRPTVWTLWGRNQAINVGDALFTYAHLAVQQAAGLESDTRLVAMRLIDEACISLTRGQHLDMAFETQETVGVEEYMTMIGGKTAALIATAAELGALAAGAPYDVRMHYRAFGHNLGLAFQIRDDVLGIWGEAAITGKSTLTDIESRKKTLPIIYGLQHSQELRKAYLDPTTGTTDALTVRIMLEEKGARWYAEREERRHVKQAIQQLGKADPQGEAGAALRKMTLQLMGRGD